MSSESRCEKKSYEEMKSLIMLDSRIMALGQLLYTATHKYANNTALSWRDRSMTYHELYSRVQHFAQKISQHGIQPGDRVLLFFENSFEFYIGYHAIAQLGAVVAPLNTFLRERELAHIIDDCKAKMLIASKELLSRLKEDHITNLPVVLTEDDMMLHESIPLAHIVKPPAHLQPDEMAALLYTSGTTGLPKGVMLSSRNIFVNVVQGIAPLGLTSQERALGVLPLFHSFAQTTCVWGSMLLGCSVIVVPKIERRHIQEGLQLEPTVILGVPALFGLLCLMRNASFGSVKYFISGGDALPDRIRAAFELIYNRKLCSGYGLSETSPALTADMDDESAPTNTVGKPLVGVLLSIRDEKNSEVSQGEIGLIWASGEQIMLGYYNAPEKTAQVIVDGWFNTGDLGYIDEYGKLVITGREKDIIVNKGFKIYPQEIENIISSHPLVIRVGVIGVEDEAAGQVPVAYVQIRQMQDGIEKQLRELCVHNLASYKVPRHFICTTDNLPTTATGKVDKKRLGKN